MRPRVLLADDEAAVRLALRRIIEDQGCDVTPVCDGRQALEALSRGSYQLVVTDLRMPEADGMAVLRAAGAKEPAVPVVVLTGYGTVERAVEAMRLGAANFLTKPFEIADVENVVREVLALGPQPRHGGPGPVSSPRLGGMGREHQLVGSSPQIGLIRTLIDQIADSDVTVLLTGESGTGKEVVAHLIHERSQRRRGPFIPVNCAAIPEALLESELFGHSKGAFTGATQARTGRFALAAGGTLFLDEVAEMPLALQAKVLRALQEKEVTPVGADQRQRVDVRILAASNRDLRKMIEAGRFREDLYYRLNVIPIHIPPLRQRPEDVPALCRHFLVRSSARRGRGAARLEEVLAEDALALLREYGWPGNVRELENVVERILHLRAGKELITAAELPLYTASSVRMSNAVRRPAEPAVRWTSPALPEDGLDLRGQLESIEHNLIRQALTRTGGNQREAAALLRLNRTTLVEKLKRLKVKEGEPGEEDEGEKKGE